MHLPGKLQLIDLINKTIKCAAENARRVQTILEGSRQGAHLQADYFDDFELPGTYDQAATVAHSWSEAPSSISPNH